MKNPMERVRATNSETGEQYTTTRYLADRLGHKIAEDRPATDQHGNYLPPKPRTTIEPATKGKETKK